MAQWLIWVLVANTAVGLVVISRLLRRPDKEPVSQVAWILAILALPGLGMLLYWLVASNRLRRKVRRRRRRVAQLAARLRHWAEQQAGTSEQAAAQARPGEQAAAVAGLSWDLRGVERLARRLGDMPAVGGNDVRVYHESNATYSSLANALHEARRHIHLEYYIWRPDATGTKFRDLLVERARAGVEVRLLLDAVGCLGVRKRFLQPLREAGARVAFYLPMAPWPTRKRWSVHLRNHRKIVVVDSQVGFIGSQNIGDEYRGRLRKYSPWFDSHMRVSGPVALFLQQTFAEDWYLSTRERLDDEAHFAAPQRAGHSIVQIISTGPDQSMGALIQIMFAAVATAERSIRIATPYFVPGFSLRMALAHACYRGVQVRLVLPTRSDVPLALWAARSFYPELLEAGVEICEFGGGVLHSKMVTVDDRWCLLGSANMDARSFRLNFETTALVYDERVATEQAAVIDDYCGRARRVTLRDVYARPLWRQLGEGGARLFSPLL